MNPSDFERLLREKTTPQLFPLEEDKWLMLESELQRRRSKKVFLYWKTYLTAASLVLAAFISYYALRDTASRNRIEIVHSGFTVTSDSTQRQREPGPAHFPEPARTPYPTINDIGQALAREGRTPNAELPYSDSIVLATVPVKDSLLTKRNNIVPIKNNTMPLFDVDDNLAAAKSSGVDLGFSALYGFSTISRSQYRVSLDAKKAISGRLFAKVQIVASGADMHVNSMHQYQVVEIGPQGAAPVTSTKQTEAMYNGSIYTLGLTPSIGVRIGKALSISAGPDVQKALTNAIPLTNKEDFRNQINNQTIVDDKQEVAGLDLGLQSTVQVEIRKRFALNLLYRYGLTDYLKKGSINARNSFMCIGVSYKFK